MAKDGEDGFYAPVSGDGFLVSDGDWTPVTMDDIDSWVVIIA
jgi:hypothetical protein